jgi:hypothetical protein
MPHRYPAEVRRQVIEVKQDPHGIACLGMAQGTLQARALE